MLKLNFNRFLQIFLVKGEERFPTLIALVYFCILNAINVAAYWDKFSVVADKYHRLFVDGYIVSGFDPLTYEVLSAWFPAYDVHRHPLLAFFMWPLSMLNQGLMAVTGVNFAIVLTAIVLVFCATYSFLFLYRILRNVIGISQNATLALSAMYFTMGFVMLSSMVPDHFVMSQFCLLLTLWLAGEKLKKGSALNMWQTIALFIITAGVSLNNGLKIFLAALVTRRRRFFEWKFLLFACILPAVLMWGVARWEYTTYRLPREKARHAILLKKNKAEREALRQKIADTITDKSRIDAVLKAERQRLAEEKYRRDHQQAWNKNKGKALAKTGFMSWTDTTTDRWKTAVHNLFGEAIQLHKNHALEDVLKKRPLFVEYTTGSYLNYAVEGIICLLFVIGIWCGRRSLFMWTALSMFILDMALHMGLGFGINEIYIMTAHYMFVLPIAMAYTFRNTERKGILSKAHLALVFIIAAWLLQWNLTTILTYLSPLPTSP